MTPIEATELSDICINLYLVGVILVATSSALQGDLLSSYPRTSFFSKMAITRMMALFE
jgi:hypothetical protein